MSKKIRNIVIILGILVVAVGICAGLGYYYILAPNTNVKDDGIIYLRDNSTHRCSTPCEDMGISKIPTPPVWSPD